MSNYFELIDDYLAKNLTEDQNKDFEKAMASDEKLKHAVDNYHLINKISGAFIEDEVRNQLIQLESASQTPSAQITKIRKINWLAIAASLAFVIGSYLIFTNLSNDASDDMLVKLYDKPSSNIVRGEETSTTAIDSAIALFSLNRFDEAQRLFEQKPANDSLTMVANYYTANIYLLKKNYTEAEKMFSSFVNDEVYGYQAQYNLMLCYLATNQVENARKIYSILDEKKLINSERKKILETYFSK